MLRIVTDARKATSVTLQGGQVMNPSHNEEFASNSLFQVDSWHPSYVINGYVDVSYLGCTRFF